MNRRQETVLWIGGLLIAVISAYHGYDEDWIYAYVIPISIVAALFIYRFRAPRPPNSPEAPSSGAAVGVLIVLGFLALHHARRAENIADTASYEADSASSTANDASSKADDAERRVEDVDGRADNVENRVEEVSGRVDDLESEIQRLRYR